MSGPLFASITDRIFAAPPPEVTRADVVKHIGQRGLEALDFYGRMELMRDRYFDSDGSPWVGVQSFAALGSRSARRDGRNAYTHWTEPQLLLSRDAARVLDAEDPVAQGILNNLVNFTVGKGPSVTFVSAKGKDVGDANLEKLSDRYKAFGDRLRAETGGVMLLDEYWREYVRTAIIDGEQATHIVPAQGGATIRRVEPEQITQPPDGSEFDGWHMGVLCDPRDVTRRHGYWVARQPGEVSIGDFVRCRDLVFYKRNTPTTVVRGVSDFFSVTDDLEDTGRLIDGIRVGARVRAKVAYIEKLNGSPPTAAADFAAGQATETNSAFMDPFRALANTQNTSQRQGYTRRLPLGSILTSTDNVDITTLPQGQSLEAIAAAQFCMRVVVCCRWCMPEHVATGDASNNNLASIRAAGTHTAAMIEVQQAEFSERFKMIVRRVLEIDEALGLLPQGLLANVDIVVEMPRFVLSDPLQDTQILEIQNRARVTSLETWRELAGRDNAIETERFRNERAEDPMAGVGALPGLGSILGNSEGLIPGKAKGKEEDTGNDGRVPPPPAE